MTVKCITSPIQPDIWVDIDTFLYEHAQKNVFQSPEFYNLYFSLKNYNPFYFLLYNENVIEGLLLAVIITEGNGLISRISKRCVIQGGPIVKADNPKLIDPLLKALNSKISRGTLITQFRNYRTWEKDAIEVFNKNGFIFHDHLNLIVSLTDTEETLKGISASRRRQIRKGLELGVVLKPASDLTEVREFYLLLLQLYHKKVKKPLPKWPFFEQFYKQLVPKGKGIILLVWFEGKIIGGIVAPITPGKMMYELYICGRDKEFASQYPSVLATWAALEWGLKHKITAFDFLGLGKPNVPYGVRDFKLRFGGEQVNFGRFARSNFQLMYTLAETGYNILRKLKRV